MVDADAMAHFDCLGSIYSLAHNVMGLSEKDSIHFLKDKLTRDYNEISDNAKKIIKEKYEKIIKSSDLVDIFNRNGEIKMKLLLDGGTFNEITIELLRENVDNTKHLLYIPFAWR